MERDLYETEHRKDVQVDANGGCVAAVESNSHRCIPITLVQCRQLGPLSSKHLHFPPSLFPLQQQHLLQSFFHSLFSFDFSPLSSSTAFRFPALLLSSHYFSLLSLSISFSLLVSSSLCLQPSVSILTSFRPLCPRHFSFFHSIPFISSWLTMRPFFFFFLHRLFHICILVDSWIRFVSFRSLSSSTSSAISSYAMC